MSTMHDLFDTPIKAKKVKAGIYAYQYRNGTINIDGTKFLFHSMTSAISAYRKANK